MVSVYSENVCEEPISIRRFIPYEKLRSALNMAAEHYGLPVSVEIDEFKITSRGSLLSSALAKANPCVVIYSSEHRKDYNCIILAQQQQGNVVFLSEHISGRSKNYMYANAKSTGIIGGIMKARATSALQEEENYYSILGQVISDAVQIALKSL